MTDDQAILEELRSGTSGKALSRLYRHLPAIRRMISCYGGDRQQAEDVFQEALIVFCRKAQQESFRLSAGIYPYLYSVCRFLWQDELRKAGRMPLAEIGDVSPETVGDDLAGAIAEEARFRLAEKVIIMLGDRCRELLLLFYRDRMKLKDIAARMGYGSEQSAKAQKFKCLENARAQYRQEKQSIDIL